MLPIYRPVSKYRVGFLAGCARLAAACRWLRDQWHSECPYENSL